MGSEQPVMGKIYDRMFLIGESIKASDAPWKDAAEKIHADRWEYLCSPFHAAGYALDPEFLDTDGDSDQVYLLPFSNFPPVYALHTCN
mmetsp:Transcript_40322/g.88511  ORF Transcript_40322/g.88511 Transcript_40322/m.88511 type:complete len:88 (+) Transcript_40322:173-436(+)